MEPDPLQDLATSNRILGLARAGLLDSRTLRKSLELAGAIPKRKAWEKFLDIGLLVIGAAFLISGIFFFFAYNWSDMHRFLRFGVVGLIMLGLITFVSTKRLSGLPAKISFAGAALLVGALLVVISQGYQTGGADPYRLFLGWAGLIAGWVLISSFTPLWVLLLVLVNIGLVLYWDQALAGPDIFMYSLLFGINGAAVLVWELGQRSEIDWLRSRWTPRLFALAAYAFLVVPTVQFFFELDSSRGDPNLFIALLFFVAFSGLILYYYFTRVLDLFILTIGAFSIIAVITSFIISRLSFSDAGQLLLVGLVIIVQAGLAVTLLRRVEALGDENK